MAQQKIQSTIISMLKALPGDRLYVSLEDVHAKINEGGENYTREQISSTRCHCLYERVYHGSKMGKLKQRLYFHLANRHFDDKEDSLLPIMRGQSVTQYIHTTPSTTKRRKKRKCSTPGTTKKTKKQKCMNEAKSTQKSYKQKLQQLLDTNISGTELAYRIVCGGGSSSCWSVCRYPQRWQGRVQQHE